MASRKEQNEQAKEQRVEAQTEADAARRRQNRIKGMVAAVGLALIVVIVMAVVLSGNDKGGDASDIQGAAEVNDSIGAIPQDGVTLGDPKAKATIHEFGDLQCPACKAFADNELPTLTDEVIKTGKAKMVFENFTIIGPQSKIAAKAALAAGEQDRYWQFVELFYRNQGIENTGYVTDDFLEALAKAAGVEDIAKWNTDRKLSKWDANIAAVTREATKLDFNGTPAFQVVGSNGKAVIPEHNSASSIEDAVDEVQ